MKNTELLEIKERYQKQYLDNAEIKYNFVKKTNHDMHNKLAAIYTLLSENEIDKAKAFIKENAQIVKSIESVIKTDNAIVDSIINMNISAAKTFGISTSCICVKSFDGIKDIDLCSLLSNMLDNALTACIDDKVTKEKSISIKISHVENIYTFVVKNTTSQNVMKNNPSLDTTKEEKESHGFGIQIINDIAQKYNGRTDFFQADDYFNCVVTLKT